MIKYNLLESKIIQNICEPFFVHVNQDKSDEYKYSFDQENIAYEELSQNDFALHKQLIEEGHNPNEIAKIIRNDEIEKLQEISSQTNFDFNQIIEPSLYERCSFINTENITLIDYAVIFSAIKCFKYLLMNNANKIDTGKYPVTSGNKEIIYLCEQNHSSFEGAYKTAIMFHQNDIFKYLYDNKFEDISQLDELREKCISYFNNEIFTNLEKEGMKIMKISLMKQQKLEKFFL